MYTQNLEFITFDLSNQNTQSLSYFNPYRKKIHSTCNLIPKPMLKFKWVLKTLTLDNDSLYIQIYSIQLVVEEFLTLWR